MAVWEKMLRRGASVAAVVASMAALSACAIVSMKEKPSVQSAPPDMALVNFVRPSVIGGDPVSVDIWDGEHLIGSLNAGTKVQYAVAPGPHVFMAKARNWSYVKADVAPGKMYFIKANIFPGVPIVGVALGVAQKDDKRIPMWLHEYQGYGVEEAERKQVEATRLPDAQKALEDFRNGGVTRFLKIAPEDGL